MAPETDKLQNLIKASKNMVVLTGAGISTESGIPDFRSPGGIWNQYRIIEYSEFMASEAARLEDWRRRFAMEDMMGEVHPNIGHKVVAGWINAGRCSCLVTQNIDGLHQQGGAPEDAVIEIHGNARRARCTNCGEMHSITECRKQVEGQNRAPVCRNCGGIVKTAVIMFGQAMPVRETEQAFGATERCDLFISIGTSLVVRPAADLPLAAKQSGAKLVIINGEETPLDPYADLVVQGGIGEILDAL